MRQEAFPPPRGAYRICPTGPNTHADLPEVRSREALQYVLGSDTNYHSSKWCSDEGRTPPLDDSRSTPVEDPVAGPLIRTGGVESAARHFARG